MNEDEAIAIAERHDDMVELAEDIEEIGRLMRKVRKIQSQLVTVLTALDELDPAGNVRDWSGMKADVMAAQVEPRDANYDELLASFR